MKFYKQNGQKSIRVVAATSLVVVVVVVDAIAATVVLPGFEIDVEAKASLCQYHHPQNFQKFYFLFVEATNLNKKEVFVENLVVVAA